MPRRLTLLFAVAGGAAVGNLYYAQPLLEFIARDFHASASDAGWLVTATQVGYAVGILLIVPLGDVVNRRRLIPAMLLCAVAALVACGFAPSLGTLLVTTTALGLTTVAGQLLTPLAGAPLLLKSVGAVLAQYRVVRWTLVLGGTGFAAFMMFWTALTFVLSAPPFRYPVSVIGLFGLAGLVGALAAQRAGRLHDRGWALPATGIAWATAFVAFTIAGLGRHSVIAILLAVVLLDASVQAVNILNQTRLFAVSNAARSRLNTTFVVTNFIGGALGSAAATALWPLGGWPAVCTAGAMLSVIVLLIWTLGRRGPLVLD